MEILSKKTSMRKTMKQYIFRDSWTPYYLAMHKYEKYSRK
jgi:hypothetical protein